MVRRPLSIGAIVSIGYDVEYHILEVEFEEGSLHQYFNVPIAVYYTLIKTPPTENYFEKCVQGQYPSTLIQTA